MLLLGLLSAKPLLIASQRRLISVKRHRQTMSSWATITRNRLTQAFHSMLKIPDLSTSTPPEQLKLKKVLFVLFLSYVLILNYSSSFKMPSNYFFKLNSNNKTCIALQKYATTRFSTYVIDQHNVKCMSRSKRERTLGTFSITET